MKIEIMAWVKDSGGQEHRETITLTEPQLVLLARQTLEEQYGRGFDFIPTQISVVDYEST